MARPKKSDKRRIIKQPKREKIPGAIRKVEKEYATETGKRMFTYKDVEYDIDDWADCSRFLPADYDLMNMRTADGRVIPGWCTGTQWHGLRLKDHDVVIAWKRRQPEPEVAKVWGR